MNVICLCLEYRLLWFHYIFITAHYSNWLKKWLFRSITTHPNRGYQLFLLPNLVFEKLYGLQIMKQENNMRHARICRSEYLLLNRVVRPNSVRSFMLSSDIMFIILFIAFDASLFLKNELISDRKFVSLTLSIGFVTVCLIALKLLIFCYLQKYPMLFLHPFLKI